MRIGILGGTGPAGRGMALRLASAGHDVAIGSRAVERAQAACDELRAAWPDRSLSLEPADNEGAAKADVVVVATPWDGVESTVRELAGALDGKVVVSMANALVRIGREFQALIPPRGSVAAHVQAAAPGAAVAAAFHHLPAKELAALDGDLEGDVLVCTDDDRAREVVAGLVRDMPNLRPLDAGSLVAAGPVESLTAVLLQLNVRYRTRASIRVTGVEA